MHIYWFRTDDVRPQWHKLCSACCEQHQLTGTREERADGFCQACGWSVELELSLSPSPEFYEAERRSG